MTSIEEFKKQLLEAAITASEPLDEYHDAARRIVNIERQAFYGDQNERLRLKRIREEISQGAEERGKLS